MAERVCSVRLLAVLYIGFISLGLPDTVLGVAWPMMRHSLDAPLAGAGILTSLTTVLSVGASLSSIWLLKRLHTGQILAISALTTALAMLGYAWAPAFAVAAFFTVFFGVGQGAVDSAVNAYMSRHYSVRQMNLAHAFWGLGATAGPLMFALNFKLGGAPGGQVISAYLLYRFYCRPCFSRFCPGGAENLPKTLWKLKKRS